MDTCQSVPHVLHLQRVRLSVHVDSAYLMNFGQRCLGDEFYVNDRDIVSFGVGKIHLGHGWLNLTCQTQETGRWEGRMARRSHLRPCTATRRTLT